MATTTGDGDWPLLTFDANKQNGEIKIEILLRCVIQQTLYESIQSWVRSPKWPMLARDMPIRQQRKYMYTPYAASSVCAGLEPSIWWKISTQRKTLINRKLNCSKNELCARRPHGTHRHTHNKVCPSNRVTWNEKKREKSQARRLKCI